MKSFKPICFLVCLGACQPDVTSVPVADSGMATGIDSGVPLDAGVLIDSGVAQDAGALDAGLLDAGRIDAGTADAGPVCAPQSHFVDGGCKTELEWISLPVGPAARDHHGTALIDVADASVLFVTNGVDDELPALRNDSWYSVLGADGFPGPWVLGPQPLFPQIGHAMAQYENRVYSISGTTYNAQGVGSNTTKVESISFDTNGVPQVWRQETQLPAGRFHITSAQVGRFIYALGGRNEAGTAMSDVWKCEVLADGVLSAWSATRAFPMPRTHHTSYGYNNKVYVVGGFDSATFTSQPTEYQNTLVSDVGAQGELGPWRSIPIPFIINTHSNVLMDGYLYLLGGFKESITTSDSVRRTKLSPTGEYGSWEVMSALPFGRSHVHQTPAKNGKLYSVGGNTGNHVPTNEIFIGNLY
jgi:hypothetical protein